MFLIDVVKYGWKLHKYNQLLNEVYKDEKILEHLKDDFGLDFQRAWFGRLYTIVNPLIKNDKMDYDNIIYDLENGNINADQYMNKICVNTLTLMKGFIIEKELYDMLVYKLERLDKYGNYLFILQPLPYTLFVENLKKTLKFLGITGIIGVIGLIIAAIVLL